MLLIPILKLNHKKVICSLSHKIDYSVLATVGSMLAENLINNQNHLHLIFTSILTVVETIVIQATVTLIETYLGNSINKIVHIHVPFLVLGILISKNHNTIPQI